MSGISIRVGSLADAPHLAPRLRAADVLELELASGLSAEQALRTSIRHSSEVWAVEEDGLLISVAGLTLIKGASVGIPWMVGSDDLLRHPVRLVREGRLFVGQWERQCAVLTNFVHAENAVHIEWLKRIGFEMGPLFPQWGAGKAPFIQFYRHSTCAEQA